MELNMIQSMNIINMGLLYGGYYFLEQHKNL